MNAQSINGSISSRYSPKRLSARIEWSSSSGKKGEIPIPSQPPFVFRTGKHFGDEDKQIDLTPIISDSDPKNLVPDQALYALKLSDGKFQNVLIILKNKSDFNIEYRSSAESLASSNPLEALIRLDKSYSYAETNRQKLETLRLKSSILGKLKRYQEQQSVLAESAEYLDSGTGTDVTKNYWAERFDNFIKWTNYLGFRLPDEAFGKEVIKSEDLLTSWRTYINDLDKNKIVTLETAQTEEDVTRQLLAVKKAFGYK